MHLKQSTASQSVTIGPFVDATDAVTAESGLTIANTDIRLSANGGNIAAKNSGGGTYDEAGMYTITLDATDTATVGRLQLICNMSGALPVYHEYEVIEENVYDMLYAASADLGTMVDAILTDTGTTLDGKIDTIDTNVDAILVDTGTTLDTKINNIQGTTFNTATDSLEAIRDRGDSAWTGSTVTSDSGTAQAGSASTITLQAGASASNDTYNGQLLYISSGTGVGQSRAISDYVGSTKVATVITNFTVTPDATSGYAIYPNEITEITAAPSAAANAAAVWDLNTAGHTTAGTFGEQCKNDIDAILTDTGTTLDAALAVVDANVDAILVDTGTTLDGKADQIVAATITNAAGVDIAADIIAIKAETAAILTDTGTTLDGKADQIVAAVITNAAGVDIAADIIAVKADTAAILTDTGTTLDAALAVVDSNVDAIKAKTDSLTFTVSGEVDSNVQSVNDVTVLGVGTAGNKWRA